jgi:hypothetical protein
MEKFNQLKSLVESMTEDYTKFFEKGNSAAGTRVRKSLQDIKKLAQEIRVEVSEKKKSA